MLHNRLHSDADFVQICFWSLNSGIILVLSFDHNDFDNDNRSVCHEFTIFD